MGGYSTVVAGTTITSTWGNTYVRDQVVSQFASASARDSAITSPVAGMICYTADIDWVWRYNGSKWMKQPKALYVPAVSSAITTTTFVDISGLTFTGDANSTYPFDGWLSTVAATAGDVGLQWVLPSGASLEWGVLSPSSGNAGTNLDTTAYQGTITATAGQSIGGMNSTGTAARVSGVIVTGVTAGTCKLQANNPGATGSSFVRAGFLMVSQVA